ncbi:hypothetical protein ACWCP6_25035 [Streptomyces sp. NPDC002004]
MSNSLAAAVLTTPDLACATDAVRTLLDLADLTGAEVDFEAEIRSPDVLSRICRLLPDLTWWAKAGSEHGCSDAGDDPAQCLPIRIHDWSHPLDLAEPFIASLGPDRAAVRFDLGAWPAVPDVGLEEISQKYAYLTLSVNCRDLYQGEPSADHSIHVHVPSERHLPRVHWLARQVGGRFDGRTELAPL